MNDEELLKAIVAAGGLLLRTAQRKQAGVGAIRDDERWASPLPLRFEVQLATLFLGALDAYDVTTGILRARASQQAFNGLRFQLETLALIRWMIEPREARDRQVRAYRVLYGQLSRWVKLLREDAAGEPDAVETVKAADVWLQRLRDLATEDGLAHLTNAPDRRYLLAEHAPEVGYPTFSMFSELGAHPGAIGNTLFSMKPDARVIDYSLGDAFVARAFWSAVAIVHLWQTCESVAAFLGWDEWLANEARPIYNDAAPLLDEARRRRRSLIT